MCAAVVDANVTRRSYLGCLYIYTHSFECDRSHRPLTGWLGRSPVGVGEFDLSKWEWNLGRWSPSRSVGRSVCRLVWRYQLPGLFAYSTDLMIGNWHGCILYKTRNRLAVQETTLTALNDVERFAQCCVSNSPWFNYIDMVMDLSCSLLVHILLCSFLTVIQAENVRLTYSFMVQIL